MSRECQIPTVVAEKVCQPEPSPELGEGSLWWAAKQKLLWLDIMGSRLFVYDPATGENKEFPMRDHAANVTSVVPIAGSDDLALTLTDGFATFCLETGCVERMANNPLVAEGERFNDGKCDLQGRYWAGTIARDPPVPSGAPVHKGAFYRRNKDGSVDKMLDGVAISNGLAWSGDSKIMYWTDTLTGQIDAFDFDAESGALSNRRPCIKGFVFDQTGLPDGCCIDLEGCLWVALFNGGGAERFDPRTGNKLARVSVPTTAGRQVTSVAFGGEDLGDLYLTTAHEGVDANDICSQGVPLAGALFRVSCTEMKKIGAAKGAPTGTLNNC